MCIQDASSRKKEEEEKLFKLRELTTQMSVESTERCDKVNHLRAVKMQKQERHLQQKEELQDSILKYGQDIEELEQQLNVARSNPARACMEAEKNLRSAQQELSSVEENVLKEKLETQAEVIALCDDLINVRAHVDKVLDDYATEALDLEMKYLE